MKYYATDTSFKHPWEQTMVAVWQRYPNPFSPHVLSEDTISRRVEGSLLFTKRVLVKTNPLPKWGQRFVHIRQVAIVEESILDRDRQILVTYTRNVGYLSTLTIEEKCVYERSLDSNGTALKREAWIDSQLRGFGGVIQRFGLERYKHNASNASKGLSYSWARLFPPATITKQNSSSMAHSVSEIMHKGQIKASM